MQRSELIQFLKRQPRMGNNVGDAFKSFGKKIEDGTDAFVKLATALEGVEKANISLAEGIVGTNAGLDTQIGISEKLLSITEKLAEKSTYLERRNKEINKTFGVGSVRAAKFSQEFAKISTQIEASAENVQKYGNTIRKDILPVSKKLVDSNSTYYTGLINVQRVLTTNLGLTEEQASKYTLFAAQSGQETDYALQLSVQLTDQIAKSTNLQFSFKDITEEITKSSAATQLQFGRMPGNLELASLKAKSLGFTLDEMAKVGTQMLDIESSIGQELEYQLLSGNRLIDQQTGQSLTNRFREAALAGDMSKQADTLNDILTQEGETLENNLLARQQMSKLLGMDESSLARALQKKKILEASGAGALFSLKGDELETAAAKLVKDGKMSAQKFRELMESQDTRTTTQKMTEQMAILKEQTIIDKLQLTQTNAILDVQRALLKAVDKDGEISKKMLNLTATEQKTIGQAGVFISAYQDVTGMIKDISSGNITTKTTVNDADDLLYVPGMGTSTSGFGEMFRLNPNDAVAAGPAPAIAAMANGGGSIDMNAFASIIVSAMKQATFEVSVDPTSYRMS